MPRVFLARASALCLVLSIPLSSCCLFSPCSGPLESTSSTTVILGEETLLFTSFAGCSASGVVTPSYADLAHLDADSCVEVTFVEVNVSYEHGHPGTATVRDPQGSSRSQTLADVPPFDPSGSEGYSLDFHTNGTAEDRVEGTWELEFPPGTDCSDMTVRITVNYKYLAPASSL